MPRKTIQKTAPALTDPAEAAVAEGTDSRSQSKNKASANKDTEAKPARYGRAKALIDALKKDGTRDEITRHSDQLYVEHGGGQSSLKGARAQLDVTLSTLKAAGVVTEDEDKRLHWNA